MNPATGTIGTATNALSASWTYSANDYIAISGEVISAKGGNKEGFEVNLVFKYIKKKFGLIENNVIKRRLEKLEKAFEQAVNNGQVRLGEKIMHEVAREARESILYAKGIKYFVEKEDVWKYKNRIKGGHISDTKLEDYTRVIPKDVLKAKKKTDGYFDGYVIFHYYNREVEQQLEKKQKMSSEEKARMKDPILFGTINESTRLYFIADWEDEFCDLTFDEIIDVVGETKITKQPELNLD